MRRWARWGIALLPAALALTLLTVPRNAPSAHEPYRFTAAIYRPGAGQLTGNARTVPDATEGPVVRFGGLGTGAAAFVHPGILVGREQLAFLRAQIAAGTQPWTTALAQMQAAVPRWGTEAGVPFAAASYVAHPVASVSCPASLSVDQPNPCNDESNDATAAWANALLYGVTGQDVYAQRAIAILNGWSAVFRTRTWDPRSATATAQAALQASWVAPLFVRSAELLRYTYTPAPGAPALDLASFDQMLAAAYTSYVAVPPINGSANRMLSIDEAAMDIAVYHDDHAGFAAALARWQVDVPATIFLGSDVNPYPQLAGLPLAPRGSWFDTPTVSAADLTGAWRSPTTYPDGLEQETCRDASHMSMGLGSAADAAETARLQGIDLYATQASRLAAGFELNAGYLLGGATPAGWPCPSAPVAPPSSEWPATFENGYNELVNRLGLSLPNLTALVTTGVRPSPIEVNHNMAFEGLTGPEAARGTACPVPDPALGSTTTTIEVPGGGAYRLWVRTRADASGSNLLYAAVDGGCPAVLGGPRAQTAGQWTWVDLHGDAATRTSLDLDPGTHTIVLSGLSPDLEVSRVLLTADTSCTPSGLADTCSDAIAPTPPTTVTATAPSADTVALSWSGAGAESAVDHYVVYRDGAQVATTGATAYTDRGLAGGSEHTYTVVTVDDVGMASAPSLPATVTTPLSTLAVTTDAPSPALGTVPLSATLSDATHVTRVDYLVDGTVVASASAGPFTAGWDSTGTVNGPHTLQAVAYTDDGGTDPSDPVPFTVANPDTAPPTAPDGVTVTTLTQSSASLSWRAATDDVGVTGYTVYRDGVRLGTTPTTSYPDTGLVAGHTYRYTVTARDAAGNESPASSALAWSVPDITAPDAPTGLGATIGSPLLVSLVWNATADNVGTVSYTVLRNGTAIVTTPVTSFSDTLVAAGTGYTYTVTAADAAGNVSAASAPVTVTTPSPPDRTAPSAPTQLAAGTRTGSSIALTWRASTDNVGVAGYTVTRNGTTVTTGLTSPAFTDTGLAGATSYAYTVRAVDAAGNASAAATLTASTRDTTPPGAPGAPSGWATTSPGVTLSWAAATDDVGVTGYAITRNGTPVTTVTGRSWTDTGLVAGATYRYTVAAVDAAGNTGPAVAFATSTLQPVVASGTGLTGEYFAGTALAGTPVTRRDSAVNFSWGSAAPVTGVPGSTFSVRWTGTLTPRTSGSYKLYADTHDGVRVWLNGTLVIDRWSVGTQAASAPATLTAGTGYALRVEYFDATGAAAAKLSWSGPGIARTAVPSVVLTSRTRGLTATYYASNDLTGAPTVVRPDPSVQFGWGTGTPDPRLSSGAFSARWSGRVIAPKSATYTFATTGDNGVRLWVGTTLVVDDWSPHALTTDTGRIALTAGTAYPLRLEYRATSTSASLTLAWAYGTVTRTPVPSSALQDR